MGSMAPFILTAITIALVFVSIKKHDDLIAKAKKQDDSYFIPIILMSGATVIAALVTATKLEQGGIKSAASMLIALLVCFLITLLLLKISLSKNEIRIEAARKETAVAERQAYNAMIAERRQRQLEQRKAREMRDALSEARRHLSGDYKSTNRYKRHEIQSAIKSALNITIEITKGHNQYPIIRWGDASFALGSLFIYKGHNVPFRSGEDVHALVKSQTFLSERSLRDGSGEYVDKSYSKGQSVVYHVIWKARAELGKPIIKVGSVRKTVVQEADFSRTKPILTTEPYYETVKGGPVSKQIRIEKRLSDIELEELEVEMLERKARLAERRADLPKSKTPYRSPREQMRTVIDDVMKHFETEQEFDREFEKARQKIQSRTDWSDEMKAEALERLEREVQNIDTGARR